MSNKPKKTTAKKGKPNALIKELARMRAEAEERARIEQEEAKRREEEEERLRLEAERLEEERKAEAKRRREELVAQAKKEGKFLTKKQRQEQEKNKRLLANKDFILPTALSSAPTTSATEDGAQKKKPILYGTRKRGKKQAAGDEEATIAADAQADAKIADEAAPVEKAEEEQPKEESPKVEDLADDWENIKEAPIEKPPTEKMDNLRIEDGGENEATPISEAESTESEEASDDEDEEEGEEIKLASKDVVKARLAKRREEAEARRTVDNLRAPVICVLGHVDTGKTKMLDTIRRTNVQDAEAGGITQQIGATRIPDSALVERCKHVRGFDGDALKLPGFLVIDTPGHESFANLRSRGSSLCDFAILVVDIMHGLEPQTIESLKLLLRRKTPFVVALNKVDRLYGYESNPRKDIWQHLRAQPQNTQLEFQKRWDETIAAFATEGINVALAKDKKDPEEYVSVVPTSAFHGDGIGNLLAHIVDQSQTILKTKLAFCEELDCTVMEVRSLPGLGMTIDVILVNGTLRVNDFIILSGIDEPIVTMVRDLLMPAPLREIRVKNEYQHYKEIKGAQGVKILAKKLDSAIAGLPLYATTQFDEVEVYTDEARKQLEQALTSIHKKSEGVYVQASTLGSLEALLEFLKAQKIPYSNVNIGPVHKKDVQKAAVMLEHNPDYACILAFDVSVDREVQQFADRESVRIFQADIIYHLESSFLKHREDLRLKRRRENEHLAVFPCWLRILPQHIFNARNPIVLGVSVEQGKLKKGAPLMAKTPSAENPKISNMIFLGTVTSIEHNHEVVEIAKAGQECSIKIENTTGEAPKLYGRHFTHTDPLMSRISRQTIDVCKEHFRQELSPDDWMLIKRLKVEYGIL